jgi:hypothetical protein
LDKIAYHLGFKRWSLVAKLPNNRNVGWCLFVVGGHAGSFGSYPLYTAEQAVDSYNKAIPLTQWQSGFPTIVGEYNASIHRNDEIRRWFDGSKWSLAFNAERSKTVKDSAAKRQAHEDVLCYIKWRGLSKPPIILEK